MEALGDILSSLSADDIAKLQSVASSVLQGDGQKTPEKKETVPAVPAVNGLQGLSGDELSMLLKLVGKYALAQDGVICFSAKDLERLPSGFEEQAGEIAAGKGGSLKVSRETRDIPNGFVLVYGGVEENCTLKAMFEAKRDELADKVNHLIFSQA